MTTEIDLLPLPEKKRLAVRCERIFGSVTAYGHSDDALRDYARANVARNTALLRAEIKALREGEEVWKRVAAAEAELRGKAEERAERLAEALRLALDSHGVMLLTDPPQDAWKVHRVEEIGRALLRELEEDHEQ